MESIWSLVIMMMILMVMVVLRLLTVIMDVSMYLELAKEGEYLTETFK